MLVFHLVLQNYTGFLVVTFNVCKTCEFQMQINCTCQTGCNFSQIMKQSPLILEGMNIWCFFLFLREALEASSFLYRTRSLTRKAEFKQLFLTCCFTLENTSLNCVYHSEHYWDYKISPKRFWTLVSKENPSTEAKK